MRAIVLASGVALAVAGAAAILLAPVPGPLRACATLAWLALSAYELVVLALAYRQIAAYRVHADGTVDLLGPPGTNQTGWLAEGSVMLGRLGWLCVRRAPGGHHAELVRGNPRKNKEWRRFCVIFRHLPPC